MKWDAIDFENKKISIQHTVVTAKVNGTVTEIARDKTKAKSSCRTLPLTPACEQMLNRMKKEQEQNRKVCGKSYCNDYLDYIYVDPMGKRIRPDFLSQHFPDFLVAHQMKRIRFPRPAPPVCQAHDKKYILQKQKSQTTNFDLIVWGFCFCVALVPLFLLKMPVTVWHFHITNSHQGFLIITDSVY